MVEQRLLLRPYGAYIRTDRMILLSSNTMDSLFVLMTNVIQPFHLLLIALARWLNRHELAVIGNLIEENRVLKDQLEGQRIRFTDKQRVRLAVKAKVVADEHSMKSKRF
jgi:hypothetical protein